MKQYPTPLLPTENTGKRLVRVSKERDVRIHAHLWHTADVLLGAGQVNPTGSAHEFMASLVFRAFALEAFLNWIGRRLIAHWQYLDRLKPHEKLELIAETVGLAPDYAKRPWQIMKELFGFRNDIAHGKPESLSDESIEALDDFLDGKLGEVIATRWEKFCRESNAVRAKEDVEEIANLIYSAAKINKPDEPVGAFAFGFQTHSATVER